MPLLGALMDSHNQQDDSRKDKAVQVRMTEKLATEAKELADAIGVNVSTLLRMALIEKIARYRKEMGQD